MSNLLESTGNEPKLKEQHADIAVGSPLAMIGLFTEVIRSRFRGDNRDTGYIWRADPTPLPTEQNTPDDPRTLYIEPGDASDPDARDFKPAVFITKEDTQLRQVVIGDRSNFDRQTRTERFYMQAVIPITVQVVSDNRAESALLADLVWFHLAAARNYVRAEFGIFEIAPPILGRTSLFRRVDSGQDGWITPVSFATTIEFHWITRPIAPLLKEISARLTASGGGDLTAGAIDIVLRNQPKR